MNPITDNIVVLLYFQNLTTFTDQLLKTIAQLFKMSSLNDTAKTRRYL